MDLGIYKTIDDLAFADDLLIYNVLAYDIPKDVFSTAEIKKFFAKFGAVFKVEFLSCKEKCRIYFVQPQDAAKVLKKTSYFHKNHCIRVQPCTGFNQPDGAKLIDTLDRVPKSGFIKIQQNALILTLNDDCLENIFKNLCRADQINFALTCQRFYHIMVMRSKVDYAFLNTDIFHGWTTWRIQIFLQIVGPQIKSLEIKSTIDETVYEILGSYCTNVEKLDVDYCHNSETACKLVWKMQLLQEFKICGNISDDLFEHLIKCKDLKSLIIQSNELVTGKYIHLLDGLEKLEFNRCSRINSKHFQEICKNLKKLRYLDVCRSALQKDDYGHISEHLLELKTLKINGESKHFCHIMKSPNFKLKHLEVELGYHALSSDIFFENLAKSQGNQLECLKFRLHDMSLKIAYSVADLRKLKVLYLKEVTVKDEHVSIISQLTELEEIYLGNCSKMAENSVVQLLEKCLKLKHLQLKQFPKMSPDFLRNVLKLLQDQRARSLRPESVTMHIDNDYSYCIKEVLTEVNKFPDVVKFNVEFLYPDDDDDDYDYYQDDSNSSDYYYGGYNSGSDSDVAYWRYAGMEIHPDSDEF